MEVRIDQLGKRYQHGWVFKDLSYIFKSDNIYGVAGRNGSGKSTFLKIISGLLSPSKGRIEYLIDGRLELRENIYSKVNIAAPYTDLIEELDLREMIRFHTKFKHSPVLTTAGQWLEMLELSNASSRPLLQFSSGMKQRVKLGLALYSSGDILLLDEPTSNLDDAAKAWFFTHLAKLRKDKLILIASNEAEDFKYCAEILRLY
ncbi:MAG: ABC transporter ATP-binding protein [Saprospiraceae bacterium]|nr:ABC transporter ATP-binding protein [Saprospiraceae bacterium]